MKGIIILLVSLFSLSGLWAQVAHQELRAGNADYRDGNYADAEVHYLKSLSQSPSVKGNYNLANALHAQDRHEEAIRRYEYVVNNTSDDGLRATAYHNLGNAYFSNGELEASIDAFKNALRINPQDASTRYNLAQAQRVFYEKASFDLALKLKAQKRPLLKNLKVGDVVIYDIKILNEGQIGAKEVSVANYTPPGMTLDDPYWSAAGSGAIYRGRSITIAPGDSVTITQQLKVTDISDPEKLINAMEIAMATNRFNKKDVDSTPMNASETPDEDDFAADGDGNESQDKQDFNKDQEQDQQQQEQQEQQEQQQQEQDQQNQEQQQSEQQQNEQQQSEEEAAQQSKDNESGDPKESKTVQAGQLTEEEAKQLLEIIEQEELKVLQKSKKVAGKKKDKDW